VLLLATLAFLGIATAIRPLTTSDVEVYSFESFVEDFSKTYASPDEYEHRRGIFCRNRDIVLTHNRQRQQHQHQLGVNEFMDATDDEIPKGYEKASNTRATQAIATQRRLNDEQGLESLVLSPVAELPNSVDWRQKGVVTPVKSQGGCGSCWAFATTAMLESHVAIHAGVLFELSTQELVSCMENPLQCGGNGGCTGATAELALEFVRQHGMVQEWEFGYQSYHGAAVNCTLQDVESALLRGANKTHYKGAVASIQGWVALPTNNYTTLMNAVAKVGPVAVSVAATPWALYKEGVFESSMKSEKETNVNHLVVLDGYGTDEETGVDYWLVRNSWGPMWGEDGYIRLKRVDPVSLTDPEMDCGMDVTPSDGVACTIDDKGNSVIPPAVKVCGTSGILFDSSLPLGPYLVK
jgi:cathepsin L